MGNEKEESTEGKKKIQSSKPFWIVRKIHKKNLKRALTVFLFTYRHRRKKADTPMVKTDKPMKWSFFSKAAT